jgi:tetratricopeptide (TPR) repeat protein
LKASLQSGGKHLRLTARLISAASGFTVWAERYDCDLREQFKLQDDVAREIVVALQAALTEGEQARFWHRGTQSGLAWEQFQLGRDQECRYTRGGHRNAKGHYQQALRLDPSYLSALVALGFCHLDEIRLGWSDDEKASLGQAEAAASRAAGIDPDHPDMFSLIAFVRFMQGRPEEAVAAMDKAVAAAGLNSEIIAYQGTLRDLLGNFHAAIRSYTRALSLSPHSKPWIGSNLGLSYLAIGEAQEAEKIYRDVIANYPDYERAWTGLAVALLRQYKIEEAREAAQRVLLLDPRFTVAGWGKSRPFDNEVLLQQFMADLREVGLPP